MRCRPNRQENDLRRGVHTSVCGQLFSLVPVAHCFVAASVVGLDDSFIL